MATEADDIVAIETRRSETNEMQIEPSADADRRRWRRRRRRRRLPDVAAAFTERRSARPQTDAIESSCGGKERRRRR